MRSYEQLRARLIILQAQILKLTGREPMDAFRHNLMSVMQTTGPSRSHTLQDPTRHDTTSERRHSDDEERCDLRYTEIRDPETGPRSRRDSRRKGMSGGFADVMLIDQWTDIPYLAVPLTPMRGERTDE